MRLLYDLDGEYFIIDLGDNRFYKRANLSLAYTDRTTTRIEEARRYNYEWEIPKDLYLQMFIENHNLDYNVIKVKVKTVVDKIDDE